MMLLTEPIRRLFLHVLLFLLWTGESSCLAFVPPSTAVLDLIVVSEKARSIKQPLPQHDSPWRDSLTLSSQHNMISNRNNNNYLFQRHRHSVAHIQTMALFGLGGAEIAVIVVVVTLVLGPNQIGNIAGKFAGRFKGEYDNLPDELKKIPKEFQKGYQESTETARARNAKPMERVPDDEEE